MNTFSYHRAASPEDALKAVALQHGAKFLGGGTNLVDLMKYDVEHPTALVDITRLPLTDITPTPSGGVLIGAGVRNSDLANHELIRKNYPLLSQALLSGASAQLRNMATTGGNLMQRTRCYYFNDVAYTECNKRNPGSGCAALKGFNRIHAILGATDQAGGTPSCIATNPSDMNVALAGLGAIIHVQSPSAPARSSHTNISHAKSAKKSATSSPDTQASAATRTIPIADFHLLPGTTPEIETALQPGELIAAVELPPSAFAKHSYYLKVRDRQSYAFALVSVAAALDLDGSTIRSAGLALGGVALKPWRSPPAEAALAGAPATPETFRKAAGILLTGAHPFEHNAFKVELARQSIVRALTLAAHGVQA